LQSSPQTRTTIAAQGLAAVVVARERGVRRCVVLEVIGGPRVQPGRTTTYVCQSTATKRVTLSPIMNGISSCIIYIDVLEDRHIADIEIDREIEK
jgi:hypothetical protein